MNVNPISASENVMRFKSAKKNVLPKNLDKAVTSNELKCTMETAKEVVKQGAKNSESFFKRIKDVVLIAIGSKIAESTILVDPCPPSFWTLFFNEYKNNTEGNKEKEE